MLCSDCGRENAEGARFCDACGHPLSVGGAPETERDRETAGGVRSHLTRRNGLIAGGAALGLAVVLVGLALLGSGTPTSTTFVPVATTIVDPASTSTLSTAAPVVFTDEMRATLEQQLEKAYAGLPTWIETIGQTMPGVPAAVRAELYTADATLEALTRVDSAPLRNGTGPGDATLLDALEAMGRGVGSAQQAVEASLEGDPSRATSLLQQAARAQEEFRAAYATYREAAGRLWEPPTTAPPLVVTTAAPTPTTATPTTSPQPSYSEYARLTTWYTAADGDNRAWVHFKTVDEGGHTVEEALGSDIINTATEKNAMAKTAKRQELVDKLRDLMRAAGWVELGVEGDWYQYVFGR